MSKMGYDEVCQAPDLASMDALAFEKHKWQQAAAVEERKLVLEQRKMWSSNASIVIPILVLAATIFANTQAQKRATQDAFELKVAETVLSSTSVGGTQNRAEALARLFPERLPSDYPNRLTDLSKRLLRPDKARLMETLAKAPPDQRGSLLELWLLLYPDDRAKLPSEFLRHVAGTSSSAPEPEQTDRSVAQ